MNRTNNDNGRKKDSLLPVVLYEGELRSYSEAGALLVRKMIEDELDGDYRVMSEGNVYTWLSGKLGKKTSTIRKWTYDWEEKSGSSIPILDFFKLVTLTKSKNALLFLEKLIGESLNDQVQEQTKVVESIGKELINVGWKFISMSDDLDKKQKKLRMENI